MTHTRIEHDLLGSKEVPTAAYYGIQTLRAMENFSLSGVPVSRYPEIIHALAYVKMSAARANYEVGALSKEVLCGIEAACYDLLANQLHDQFAIDLLQGGAGTSLNMNANEVIANRALEHMGRTKGEYTFCDPHDHVNSGQSTNDVYPTALHVAMQIGNERLVKELGTLVAAFRTRGTEFAHVIKIGRTQLQDAIPMTMKQEWDAWGRSLEQAGKLLLQAEESLYSINMGGTAIGTGLNAPQGYAEACARHLAMLTKKPYRLAPDLVEATQDTEAYVRISSAMKGLAIKLSKICNDLRLLSSGPRAGLFEINLPPVQPGSSIMPGKVNPVIPEVTNQICFKVIGNDLTVTLAAEAGQLQLNVMEPVILFCIMESQTLLERAIRTLRDKCIKGISVNEYVIRRMLEQSIGVVTALNPRLGHEVTTQLATEALRRQCGVIEIVRERNLLSDTELAHLLDPASIATPQQERK